MLQGVTDWARENDYELLLGEFGVSYVNGSDKEGRDLLQFMENNDDVFLGWTAWAAGEWWGNYYYGLGQGYGDTNILLPFMSDFTGDYENDGVSAPAPTPPVDNENDGGDDGGAEVGELAVILAAIAPDSDDVVTRIESGSTLNADLFGDDGINIKANVYGEGMENVRSVRITMDSGESHLETLRPYAFFGDKQGDFLSGGISAGTHSVTIEAFTNRDGTGQAVFEQTINFEASGDIGNPNAGLPNASENYGAQPLKVVLALVDPATDEVIHRIKPGEAIDPADLSTGQLALKANVIGDGMENVETVRIVIDGEVERIDSARPYAVFGDEQGDFLAGALTQGDHSILVEAYATAEAEGAPMISGTFEVTALTDFVADGSAAPVDNGSPIDGPTTDNLLELLLIDVETGAAITAIENGGSLAMADLGSGAVRFEARINADAPEAGSVESVAFDLSGDAAGSIVQNVPGYNFELNAGDMSAGTYQATVAAYDQDGATGQKLDEEILIFTITEDNLIG